MLSNIGNFVGRIGLERKTLTTTKYFGHTLPNGLRIALLPMRSKVVYCGFAVQSGSRNDPSHLPGLAHFVEHMLFKGTTRRKAWHVLNRMERVGGELNAYTTKEDTYIYTSAPRRELVRSIELLSDMVRHSTYPQHELEKERIVVADEINLYKDTPAEQIFDDFEELFFAGHPLAHGILGDVESLNEMQSDDCRCYAERAFRPERMLFFCMGQVSEERFVELAERYLSEGFPKVKEDKAEQTPPKASAFLIKKPTLTHQAHTIIGAPAPNMHEECRIEASMILSVLAGSSMNTRLNLLLREQQGWVYGVDSNYNSLSDVGWWQIYFGSDPKHAGEALDVTLTELERMRREGLSQHAFRGWIKQLKGQLALSSEQSESTFLGFGRQMLHKGSYRSVQESIARLGEVTPSSMQEVAEQILASEKISTLVYEGIDPFSENFQNPYQPKRETL